MKTRIALGIGLVVIAGAFVFREESASTQTATVVVADNPQRTYIPPEDADGNGISDWQDDLLDTQLLGLDEISTEVGSDYEVPDTVTDQFAISFFEEFALGNASGRITDLNQDKFVGYSIENLKDLADDELVTYNDIVLGVDSQEAWREYGNQLAAIVLEHSIQNENEVVILQRAIETNNPEKLKELDPIIAAYTRMYSETLALPVPPLLRKEHVDLLNVYKALISDITAFRDSFEDPLLGLVRLKRYQDDATALYFAFKNLDRRAKELGIRYAQDEPGSAFSTFILE